MAEEVSIRETTVTSESAGGSEAFRERLSSVRDALREIEDEVRQDAESLERLRSLLDLSYIDEFSKIINDLEIRLQQVGDEAERAQQERDRALERLAEEEERLEKLWDVYKNQERDLEGNQGRIAELEDELESKASELEDAKAQLDASERALDKAQQKEGELRQEKADLLGQVEDLRALESSQETIDSLEDELERERERLTKLYAAYEEAQNDRDDAVAELKRWQIWYERHGEAINATGRAAREMPVE